MLPLATTHPRFDLAAELACLLPNRWDDNGNERYALLTGLAHDLGFGRHNQRAVMALLPKLNNWDIKVERFTSVGEGRCLAIEDAASWAKCCKVAADYYADVYGESVVAAA